jgi:hypothetical protein
MNNEVPIAFFFNRILVGYKVQGIIRNPPSAPTNPATIPIGKFRKRYFLSIIQFWFAVFVILSLV